MQGLTCFEFRCLLSYHMVIYTWAPPLLLQVKPFTFICLSVLLCLCVPSEAPPHTPYVTVHMWTLEDNFQELVLYFHQEGPRD